VNDEAAFGAIAAIKDRGLLIPEDIAIVSIDNIELWKMVRPALATVRVSKATLANYAIQYLISHRDHVNGQPASIMLSSSWSGILRREGERTLEIPA